MQEDTTLNKNKMLQQHYTFNTKTFEVSTISLAFDHSFVMQGYDKKTHEQLIIRYSSQG